MRIAVLSSPSSWYLNDLRRAAQGRHDFVACAFSHLTASVALPGGSESRLGEFAASSFDAVLVRSMPPGSLEQVVFRMDALASIQSAGTVVLNPPRSLEVAIDKYLALVRIRDEGFDVPATVVCQTWEAGMEAFEQLGGDVVVKPLFGGEGRGIARLDDEALAHRAFKMLQELGAAIYVQRFIDHAGHDLRLFVLGDTVWGISRHNSNDWRTNISRGAVARPVVVDPAMRDIALRTARAVGAPLAGVDVLVGRDGRSYVIEVNAVPGWRALSGTLNVDIAAKVLGWLEQQFE